MTSYVIVEAAAKAIAVSAALATAGFGVPVIVDRVDIVRLGEAAPDAVVIDGEHLGVELIEAVRMMRFVLANALIAVVTDRHEAAWAAACHRGGANCVLSKRSARTTMSAGLRRATTHGCYTDPAFDVAGAEEDDRGS